MWKIQVLIALDGMMMLQKIILHMYDVGYFVAQDIWMMLLCNCRWFDHSLAKQVYDVGN